MKGVGELVRRNLPRFGQERLELEGGIIHDQEALENVRVANQGAVGILTCDGIQTVRVGGDLLQHPIALDGLEVGEERATRCRGGGGLTLPGAAGQKGGPYYKAD